MKLFAGLALLLGSSLFVHAQTTETTSSTAPAAAAKTKPVKFGNLNSAVDWGEMKSKGAARRQAAVPTGSQFTYDPAGRVTKVLEPNKAGKPTIETDITYGASGRVTQIVQLGAKGDSARTRTFKYDEQFRLIETVSPEAGRIVYSYDAVGNIATRTDGLGTTTTYLYDSRKRIVEKSYSDATPTVRYRYSGPDHSVHSFSVIDGKRVYDRQYHFGGKKEVDYIGQRFPSAKGDYTYGIGLSYDAKGHLRSTRYPDGRVVTQDWDAKGNLVGVSDAGAAYLSGAAYTSTHLLTSATLGNGAVLTKAYDEQQRLQSLAVAAGERRLVGNVYHYNSLGSLTALDDVLSPSESIEYRYDEMNRIAGAKTEDGSLRQRFSYDAFGNKALSKDADSASDFDENNRYRGVAGLTYDGIGEMTSDGRHSYTFNAEGMITAVDGGKITYIYDADGNRVRKIVAGQTDDLIWMQGMLLAEKRANGTWIDYVYANGQRIASVTQPAPDTDGKVAPAETTYFVTDRLGVTRVALSQTADVVAAGFFAPFGEKIREKKGAQPREGKGAESISYSDEIHDAETGLDAYRYRSYNPVLGRWMSPDPSSEHYSNLSHPQTFNLYAYVVNDPLKYLDQLGLSVDDGSGSTDCVDCFVSTGTGDGLNQDLPPDSGGAGGSVDPNPPDPSNPCGPNDGTCVNSTTNPSPPIDPTSPDPCPPDTCVNVTTDPNPPLPLDPPTTPTPCLVAAPDPTSAPDPPSLTTQQQEQAAEAQAKANIAKYAGDGAQPHAGDDPSKMRLTPICDTGNKDCTYTLSGMGTDPLTNGNYKYYVWEHQTQPVRGSSPVGTGDNITPGLGGAPTSNYFPDVLTSSLDSYRFFTVSTNPIFDQSKQIPITILENGQTIAYEHLWSNGGPVYINGSAQLPCK